MCGIAGIVGEMNRAAGIAAVRSMIATLARRGPDGEGIHYWDGAIFAHRRLAIFDLTSAGSQPMLTPDSRVGVVFNGAIYNHRELREALLLRGRAFASRTDTEVLLQGYLEWGLEALVDKLRGMFAFALWDDYSKKLYLVRDRLGVKPLAYAIRNGDLAFASTPRALKAGGFASDINGDAVREFLENGFLSDERSIYSEVFKVPAGCIVQWSDGKAFVRPYWSATGRPMRNDLSFHAAVEETKRLLLDAVTVRLHADVEVAALLSGGIDSTLICWAVKHLGGDMRAFTVGTPGDPWDETAAATETAQVLGINHTVVEMSGDDIPDIGELASGYAEPFACASALGMLRVSKAISRASNVKVLLTGEGGDDVFLGYPRHRNFLLASKLAACLPRETAGVWNVLRAWLPKKGPLRRATALIDYSTGGLAAAIKHMKSVQQPEIEVLLGERLRSCIGRHDSSWQDADGRNVLTSFLQYEFHTDFLGEFMTKVDGGTMHYAIEARSPFLDQYIWEFASLLPYSIRLRHGKLKAVLRELVRSEIDPKIASRPKRGFGIPVRRWMVRRWRPWIEELFRQPLVEKHDWVQRGAALKCLNAAVREGIAPLQLWYVVVLELWLRHECKVTS
jgi:asparagine synthase (glutamine-hydrolysing)